MCVWNDNRESNMIVESLLIVVCVSILGALEILALYTLLV